MKIVEVISDTNIGGAGVLLLNRLRCTDIKKYPTTVLIPRGSALAFRLADIGIEYIEIECKGERSFDPFSIKLYRKIFKQLCPDIVNCHGSLSARIAAKQCGITVKICTRHCVFPVKKRESMMGFLNDLLSDHFIAVADAARRNLLQLGVSEEKISVIINGAEALRQISDDEKKTLKKSLNIGKETSVIGFCARLEKCKGHEWFFSAVKLLSRKNIDFKVLLIGDGSQRKCLELLSKKYGIDEKIIFCGFVDDVAPLMNIVDININCSVGTETSSLALSEGMSLGIPAVVSDYGGNPYMVRHGINGFVCPCGDSEQMANYITDLIGNKALYEKMSLACIKRFNDELNAEAMTEKTNRLYDKLYESLSQSQKSKS